MLWEVDCLKLTKLCKGGNTVDTTVVNMLQCLIADKCNCLSIYVFGTDGTCPKNLNKTMTVYVLSVCCY